MLRLLSSDGSSLETVGSSSILPLCHDPERISMNSTIHEIRDLATRLVAQGSVAAEDALSVAVQKVGDDALGELGQLVEEFSGHPEAQIPILKHLISNDEQNQSWLSQSGFAYWLAGQDEEAEQISNRSLAIDDRHVDTLLLVAALRRSDAERLPIYQDVLTLEPTNEIALSQVKAITSKHLQS